MLGNGESQRWENFAEKSSRTLSKTPISDLVLLVDS
jgi:hypothetical protein